MKNKLRFALIRSLRAAEDLVEKEIDHIFAAFLQGDQKVSVPINLDVSLTGEGLVKHKTKLVYKGTVEFEDEYDPDQHEFDFDAPGSNFGKLDVIAPDETTEGDSSTEDETASSPSTNKLETTEDASKDSPDLFS